MIVKWISEPETLPSTKGLVWFPMRWPSSYDVFLGHTELDLPYVGGAGVFPIAPEGEPQGLHEVEQDRFTLLQMLASEDLSKIVVVTTPGDLFVIAPADEGEVRGLHALFNDWVGDRETADAAGRASVVSAWTVWAIRTGELLDEIQYHMLEPTIDNGRTWQFWSSAEVDSYLRERTSRWLMETRFVRERGTLSLDATVGEYTLDPTLSQLQRVYMAGRLPRVSRWELDHGDPTWQGATPGTPRQFYEPTQGRVRLVPAPGGTGTASYVFVSSTPTVGFQTSGSTAGTGPLVTGSFVFQTLTIPAAFSWGIKYGVMADMLSREGEGNDPQRAAYCETRYADSVALARLMMGERLGKGEGS